MSPCAVFLDPPYSWTSGRAQGLYLEDDLTVAAKVRDWAVRNGDNDHLRIALCGYVGEHAMPSSWRVFEWKTAGGYGKCARGGGGGNAARERIWFSPACLPMDAEPSAVFGQLE